MEWSRIPILDKFDAISHIMPYYEYTHKAFLMLSSLCSSIRSKLDEFYSEFIQWMKNSWTCIEIASENMRKPLFLPSDLFIIKFKSIEKNI